MEAPFILKLNQDDLEKLRYNPIEIAKIELERGVLPITVKRPLPVRAEEKQSKNKVSKPKNNNDFHKHEEEDL